MAEIYIPLSGFSDVTRTSPLNGNIILQDTGGGLTPTVVMGNGPSTFGDNINAELEPLVYAKAVYGILDNMETFSATGGSVSAADAEFVCQTGTSDGGYGIIWTRRPLVYVPGLGAECRITARFTTPVAQSLQLCGMFSALNGMFFGYNGTSFGVMHRHGGALEIRTITVTNASGSSATATITLNDAAYTAAVTSGSATLNAHEIAGALAAGAAGALWHFQHIGSTIVCVSKTTGAKAGTYSVAVDGGTLTGTVPRTKAGVAPTEDWTPQADWNVDTASWYNPTKGNIFRLEYAYLGYGPLKFSMFDPAQRRFVLVHVVDWTGANTGTNFTNPSMRPGWVSASMGSTTNLTVYGASAAAYTQGKGNPVTPFAASATATTVTTETQVLTVQVRREFGGTANNGVLAPKLLSIATDGTKGAIFKLYRNPTVAGVTVHNYVDSSYSIAASDTAGTTVSGGRLVGTFVTGNTGQIIDLSANRLELVAGDELVITAAVVSGGSAEMTASLLWEEKI